MIDSFRNAVAVLATAGLLGACGGGGLNENTTVSNMSASPASYGRTSVWTISGLNLDQGITFEITTGACDNLTEVSGATAVQKQYSCRPSTLGDLVGQVSTSDGKRLASLRVSIPTPQVRLALSQGNIDLELNPVKAPISVNNFLDYVNGGFYTNTIFHRVISDFVIQGGGYSNSNPPILKTGTLAPITLESNNGLSNVRGSLAMARTSTPDSATSQFYINVVDNPSLDYKSDQEPGYAVFGKVIAGMDVVDTIKAVATRDATADLGLPNLPVTAVVVTSARQLR